MVALPLVHLHAALARVDCLLTFNLQYLVTAVVCLQTVANAHRLNVAIASLKK